MLYGELLMLPRNAANILDENLAAQRLPQLPTDVLQQIVIEHGANEEFQEQYGQLDLSAIEWRLVGVAASELTSASTYRHFSRWVDDVASRARRVSHGYWNDIDTRTEVVEHWRLHHTWLRPPVVIEGRLLGKSASLHLMEGHTRLGILRGLLQQRVISPESVHQAWLGTGALPAV
jgi:hypothetical protein